MRYDASLFVLSIVVAHVLAMIAIYVRFFLRGRKNHSEGGQKVVAGTIMGLAVVSMHYTAMASARVYEVPGAELAPGNLPKITLAISVAGLGVCIMALGILATRVERRAVQGVLEELAYHDSLTGLPNRLLLERQLHKSLATRDRLGTSLAVLFVDFNDFKAINDGFGHETGDQILKGMAAQLEAETRPMS